MTRLRTPDTDPSLNEAAIQLGDAMPDAAAEGTSDALPADDAATAIQPGAVEKHWTGIPLAEAHITEELPLTEAGRHALREQVGLTYCTGTRRRTPIVSPTLSSIGSIRIPGTGGLTIPLGVRSGGTSGRQT